MASQFDNAGLLGQKRLSSTPTAQVDLLAGAGPESRVFSGTSHYQLALLLCIASVALGQLQLYLFIERVIGQHESTYSIVFRSLCASGVFLGALVLFARPGRHALPTPWPWLFGFAVFVGSVGLMVGLFHGNIVRYYMGDTFRYVVPWLTLYVVSVCAVGLSRQGRADVLLKIVDLLALLALIDLVVTIFFVVNYPGYKVWSRLFPFLIGWGVLQNRWPRPMGIALMILALAVATTTGMRANFIASVAALPVLLLAGAQSARRLVYAGVASVLLGFVFWSITQDYADTPLAERLQTKATSFLENVSDIVQTRGDKEFTWQARKNELRNVNAFYEEYPQFLLTGAGFGAEVSMRWDTGVTLASRFDLMHQIHMGWVAYYLRNGLLGLLLLGMLVWLGIVRGFTWGSGPFGPWAIICLFFFVKEFIAGFSQNFMLEFAYAPLALGLALGFSTASGPNVIADRRRIPR